jgi:hypothetical protein
MVFLPEGIQEPEVVVASGNVENHIRLVNKLEDRQAAVR